VFFAEDAAGKSVKKLVVVDDRVAIARLESRSDVVVPMRASSA